MSRVQDIILRVRDTLADPNGDRWDDNRLIRLIDEAQKDICRRAKLLRTKKNLPIRNNTPIIELPDDMLLLDRILYNNKLLPLISHLEMDKKGSTWESDEGLPLFLVYDKQSRDKTKVYPIPIDLDDDIYIFNSPGYIDEGNQVDTDPDFGMVVGIEGIIQNIDNGILTSLSAVPYYESFVEDNIGVTIAIDESSSLITIYYLKQPITITSIGDELEIDDIFNSAIKYYVTGKALRDDMDTQNRVVGNEELQFYDRELIEAISDDMMDFTRNNTQYTANYKGAFDE